ncbi:YwmB family TATA-box binding protein [Cytobacillus depressus]|uniref:YwmB family TATA-box binding protein n=1 Tax=Cytobacillus depressus TaxID=1602942 RepID=A0A6L3VAK6_9BACI|nr:YwmB family TATA-box binding protein [Cytobacillus depressus]KAB2336532.1 YwmB family TATA-box binding protein [Cytobacillus depressus]
MKYIQSILAIIGIFSFIVLNLGNKTTVANSELDLTKIASILQDENIFITEWSLYARENMENLRTLEDVNTYIEVLKKQYPNWYWTSTSSEQHQETVAVLKRNAQKETIKILSTPTKQQVQTYVIYEVKGNGWKSELEKDLNHLLVSRTSDIFHKNSTIFSCLKGEFNDKIEESLSEEISHLLAVFHAKEVEGLKEQNFISTSAYSTMFDNPVETNGKDMNLQIGIRNQGLGEKTTLVVGTPIITIEY